MPLSAGPATRPEDAEDLTQEFFARLLAQRFLAKADRQKGKFRSFLLAAMKHFLADQWDCEHAQKRGGTRTVISFDSLEAETRYRLEPASDLTPEKMFEKQWALALLEHVLSRLARRNGRRGKVGAVRGAEGHADRRAGRPPTRPSGPNWACPKGR